MGIENEVASQGFNWFALMCALIVFFVIFLLARKQVNKNNNDYDLSDYANLKIGLIFGSFLISAAIYFLIDFIQ